jgi:CubicO group peptidase (beta-lactamase class C family)
LSNTSGIPDYIAMPAYSQRVKHRLPLAEVMAMFRDEPLRFEPGTDYGYSNSNWVLLGYILEQVTGRPYATIIRERIFAPAGMAHSGYEWEQPVIKGRATGYIDTGASVINAELHDESGMHAAGALYSTVEDVYKWDRALRDETLLPTATLSLMRQPFTQIEAGGYGYGWELHTLHGKHSTGHSGGLPGYVANYAHFDDGDLTIILLSNLGSAAWPDLTRDLAAIVFGVPYELPGKHTFIQLDPAILAAYAGDYSLTYFGRTTTLHFTVDDGALIMGTPGLPTARTSAISEDTFFARSKGEVILRFVRGADGAVTSIKLEWGGYDLTAERMAAATPKESEV